MEIAFTLSDTKLNFSQDRLLDAVRAAQVHTFGWPIGVVLENRDEYRPRPVVDGIVAAIPIEDRRSYDYWTLRLNGDFYLLKSLFEDMRTSDQIFFDTRIIRVTEALLFCSRLYSQLGIPDSTVVNIAITHRGLKDRTLTSAGTRPLHWERRTTENEVASQVSPSLAGIMPTIVQLVKELTEPLFLVFDFFKPDDSVYTGIVNNYVAGKVT